MSIFGTILTKIFHPADAAAAPPGDAAASPQPSPGAAPENKGRPPLSSQSSPDERQQGAQDANPTAIAPPGSTPAANASVDVAQILNDLAAKNSQKLDWRHSIVDMLKLLGLDSSLTARQELGRELGYAGNEHDSATMNIWLHKQVMQKLAANGGKVPDDLKN
jgi:hypothetical protein